MLVSILLSVGAVLLGMINNLKSDTKGSRRRLDTYCVARPVVSMALPAFAPIPFSVSSVMLFTTLLVFPICYLIRTATSSETPRCLHTIKSTICTNSNGSEEREEAEEEECGYHCGAMIDLNGKGKYKAMMLLMGGRLLEYKSDGLMLRRMLTL